MATEGKWTTADMALVRDVFLEAERDYATELLKDEKNRNMIKRLEKATLEELWKEVEKRFYAIETGGVAEENLERVEAALTLLLMSIKDAHMVLALTKTLDNDKNKNKNENKNKNDGGRSL